jgi:hypothetical protein
VISIQKLLSTVIQREQGLYCFDWYSIVSILSETKILCKIISFKGDIYKYIVNDHWIVKLLGCEIKSMQIFKKSRGKYLKAFNIIKFKRVLS